MIIIRRRFLIVLAVAFLLTGFARSQSALAQTTLVNGSFNEPYSNGVAAAWSPWHEERNTDVDCNTESMYRRPSWGAEVVGGNGGELWFDGSRSQHVGNSYATWRGGVVQTLSATPGTYSFSIKAWGRASQDQYPGASDTSVNFYVRVGISPSGNGNWTSADIIWGPTISPHASWQTASVEATTSGNNIAVFVDTNFAGPGNCRKHLDVWFDAATLSTSTPPTATPRPATRIPPTPNWNATKTAIAALASPTPTKTPIPTITPIPTNTPTVNWNATATVRAQQAGPTPNWNATLTAQAQPAATNIPPVVIFQPTSVPVVPTDTPEPAPTEAGAVDDGGSEQAEPTTAVAAAPTVPAPPTATAAPTGGTICINTFADENANGLRDALEGYMANVPLFIGRNGAVLHQGTSTGTETPLCFTGLEPAEYEIAQRLPGSLEMTTAGNLEIEVSQGQVIGLEFGSRIRQTPLGSDAGADQGGEAIAEVETTNSVTPVTEDNSSTPDTGRNLNKLTIAGIALSALAVLILAGILIALVRR